MKDFLLTVLLMIEFFLVFIIGDDMLIPGKSFANQIYTLKPIIAFCIIKPFVVLTLSKKYSDFTIGSFIYCVVSGHIAITRATDIYKVVDVTPVLLLKIFVCITNILCILILVATWLIKKHRK